jgi:hypothetical protein
MTITYIKQIIDQVNGVTADCGPILLYGENIDTGSRRPGARPDRQSGRPDPQRRQLRADALRGRVRDHDRSR